MVRATITVVVDVKRHNDVLRALRAICGPTRAKQGCLYCAVYLDAEDDRRLCLIEEWSIESEFYRRLRSKEYRDLLVIMEESQMPPSVQFDFITDRRGMEVVHAQRRV